MVINQTNFLQKQLLKHQLLIHTILIKRIVLSIEIRNYQKAIKYHNMDLQLHMTSMKRFVIKVWNNTFTLGKEQVPVHMFHRIKFHQ